MGEPVSYGPQEAGVPNLGSRNAAARDVGRLRRQAAVGSVRSGLSYRHGDHGSTTPLATAEAGGANERRERERIPGRKREPLR